MMNKSENEDENVNDDDDKTTIMYYTIMICQSWKLDGDDVWHKKHWWMNMVMPIVMMHGKIVEVQFTSLALRFQLLNSRSFALRQVDQLSNKNMQKMICRFLQIEKRHTHTQKKTTFNPWILKLPASPEETHFSQQKILGFRACKDAWPGKHLVPERVESIDGGILSTTIYKFIRHLKAMSFEKTLILIPFFRWLFLLSTFQTRSRLETSFFAGLALSKHQRLRWITLAILNNLHSSQTGSHFRMQYHTRIYCLLLLAYVCNC